MRAALAALAGATVLTVGGASASSQAFDWNTAYQAASPGATVTVPAGSYGSQVLAARGDLRNGTCSIADASRCVRFVMGGSVTINGNLEVHGSGVSVDGGNRLSVSGYADTEATSATSYPDHVVFQNLQAGNLGVFSSTDVTFKNADIGPSTQSTGCQRIENKIGYGGGIEVVPRNILIDSSRIHNQNGDQGRIASDCHYGGLFLVTADGLTIRNTVFERNVVYHVQIQNFGGAPPARNVLFDGNSFGCPVEWLYTGDVCDGQRSIQFDYDPAGQVTLRNNVSANGVSSDGKSGLYGCYVGSCGNLASLVESGTLNRPNSVVAPPLDSQPPPPPPPPPSTGLRKISETATTITLGWTAVPDAYGYRFFAGGRVVSVTFDPARTTVTFKKAASYRAVPLLAAPELTYSGAG